MKLSQAQREGLIALLLFGEEKGRLGRPSYMPLERVGLISVVLDKAWLTDQGFRVACEELCKAVRNKGWFIDFEPEGKQ